MFSARKSVDAALIRERLGSGRRSGREILKSILSEVKYCGANGLQQDNTPAWRAEVERRLGKQLTLRTLDTLAALDTLRT